MSNKVIDVPQERTLGMISTEIRVLQQQAQQVVLGYAIEIGRRLTEAKAMVSHGEWGTWLKEEVKYSKSTANNFMRIYDAYGADQQSLFGGEAKSQSIGNLTYTKALALLALPEEEREEFVESHDVEGMSTRELEKAIRQRDDAEKAKQAAEAAAKEAAEKLEAAQDIQQQTLENLAKVRAEAEEQAARDRKEVEEAQKRAATLEEKARKAKDRALRAEAALKSAQENPQIPEDAMERLRKEAEEAAQEQAAKKSKERAAALEEEAEHARRAAQAATERAERAEKQLKLADKDMILLQEEAQRVQESFNRCLGYLLKIQGNSEELGGKMRSYLIAVVDAMRGRL